MKNYDLNLNVNTETRICTQIQLYCLWEGKGKNTSCSMMSLIDQ